MLDIHHILSPEGPKPVGPFSHAVRAGDYLFVTGQMPTLPDDPLTIVGGGIENQTRQVMENLKLVLDSQGMGFERVVFARIYLVNFQDFDSMNKIYKTYFDKDSRPARTCIGVTGLAVGASVEIDFILAC
ncbi:MAG: enamine deaminase RidA [Rhodospirillaceae bacterium]|nr:enamine deaminase RidA [Rhodospirillaceae bacterium]MBO43681.1 enamine deaminase RidA [Rhodospirillaceae bacterium]|tara:strand:+ start:1063 stop:1452 length:390 start_codon:yes stop_codon:yes gene_type:complete